MQEKELCGALGCRQPADAALGPTSFCQSHFISACYEQLDEARHWLRGMYSSSLSAEAVRYFLTDCTRQATALARQAGVARTLEEVRLRDILHRTTELERLLKNPQKAAAIAVELRSEVPGRPWEEELETRLLSRNGALVPCGHLREIGDTLVVTQMETGRRARVRVVWQQKGSGGSIEIGIEILNSENFWGAHWSPAEGPE
jgi:hypothetical protein